MAGQLLLTIKRGDQGVTLDADAWANGVPCDWGMCNIPCGTTPDGVANAVTFVVRMWMMAAEDHG